MEKSPRHTIMTRILQYWFTPGRSFFLVLLRHPLAAAKYSYFPSTHRRDARNCLGPFLEHWLHENEVLLRDLPHIRHRIVVHYETLAKAPEGRSPLHHAVIWSVTVS